MAYSHKLSRHLCTNDKSIHVLPLLLVLLVCIGALLTAQQAKAQNPVEDFSLVNWTAEQAAELATNLVQMGQAQASLQQEIAAARQDFQAAWSDTTKRKKTAARLGELLYQKDILYALIPLAEGWYTGWERSQMINRLSGAPLDGGIDDSAVREFFYWIITLRGHLGAYGDDHLLLAVVSNFGAFNTALHNSYPAYLRYTRERDQAELARFLPPPAPRLAADGSAALKEQRIEVLDPFRMNIDLKRDALGTQLRNLAAGNQQMLNCVYGPVRAQHPDRGEISIHRKATFWYQSAPVDIQELLNADQGRQLGEFGDQPLTNCPQSWVAAKAVQTAHYSEHPITVRREQERINSDLKLSQKLKECGGDQSCTRRIQTQREALRR